jgi:hypothetical protein
VTDAQPIVVLTYGHAGAGRLRLLLATDDSLTTTAGTGLLGVCEQAAAMWRQSEGRPESQLSALGAASVRAMAMALISSLLARTGQRRWCELAAVDPAAAETFLGLFPSTRFVCLHRCCPDVIYSTLAESPWGLAGPQYSRYTATYPASTVAALTAWWVGHADPLVAFEHANPDACLRLRYEDLVTDEGIRDDLWKFLGLGPQAPPLPSAITSRPEDMRPLVGAIGASAPPPEQPGCGKDFPAEQLPPDLLARVNNLHATLGYPRLTPAGEGHR